MLQRAVTFYTVSKGSKEMEGQFQQNSGRSERADSGWTHPNLSFGQDSWDDSMILDIFDDAIRSHRTKKGKKLGKVTPDVAPVVTEQSAVIDPKSKSQSSPIGNTTCEAEKRQVSATERIPTAVRRDRNGKLVRIATTDEDTTVPAACASAAPFRKYAQTSSSSSGRPKHPYSSQRSYGDEGSSSFNSDRTHSDVPNDYSAVDAAALEESFNGMLMAWYHSGYATGRYQALLEQSKKNERNQNQNFQSQNLHPAFQYPKNHYENQQQNFENQFPPQQPNPDIFSRGNRS